MLSQKTMKRNGTVYTDDLRNAIQIKFILRYSSVTSLTLAPYSSKLKPKIP